MAIRLISEVLATSTGRMPTPRRGRPAPAVVNAERWNERTERLWYVGYCGCSGTARAFGRPLDDGAATAEARCDRCGLAATARVRWAAVPVAA